MGNQRIWNCSKVKVIPVIIGALGTISKTHHNWLDQICAGINFQILQKACLLVTAQVMRYALSI